MGVNACMHLTAPANYAELFIGCLTNSSTSRELFRCATGEVSSHFWRLMIMFALRYRKIVYRGALHTRLTLMKGIMNNSIYHASRAHSHLRHAELKGCKTVTPSKTRGFSYFN